MKIVQKILSHGLLIASLVAAFFIYLYRAELFPQWFDKQASSEVTETADAIEPASDAHPSPPDSAGAPSPIIAESGAAEESRAAAEVLTQPGAGRAEPAATAPRSSVAVPVREAESARNEAMTEVSAVAAHPAQPTTGRAADPTVAEYRPLAPEELAKDRYDPVSRIQNSVISAPQYRPLEAEKAATTAAGVISESEFQSQLQEARQHYWHHDVEAAQRAYRQLTESHPQRAEVWGELGNLYYAQNQMVEATHAYYRAIELLIEQGDAGQARHMLGAMYQLNSDKANELETRLRQAGG